MKKFSLRPQSIRNILPLAIFTLLQCCTFIANAQQSNTNAGQGALLLPKNNTAFHNSLWATKGTGGLSGLLRDDDINKEQVSSASPKINQGGKSKNNFVYFSPTTINSNKEVSEYNSGYEQHPELGVLFADAPCTNCYELIGKRTPTQKYFVKEGSLASEFILQSSLYPVHYKDAAGNWLTTTGNLIPENEHEGTYRTKGRPVNAIIDTRKGTTTLTGVTGTLTYNNNIELIYVQPDGTETSLGKANWHNYTAGDDGVQVMDAWPGIDLEMTVLVNSLKTNFVIKNAMPAYAAGKLLIRDHLLTGKGMNLGIKNGQSLKGQINVLNNSNEVAFTINNALAYEKNNPESSLTELTYTGKEDNILDIEVPGNFLNRATSSYPLIIDPLVTGTLSSGFTYTSGAFPPPLTSTSEYCTNTNTISVPAAATLTDIQVTFNYYGPPAVSWGQSRLSFQINGACTYGWLSCSAAASSSGIPGNTCGLLNSSFWAAAASWGTTSGCIPSYSCTGYSLPFQLLLTQAQTSTAACSQTVYATASGFTVTLFGTTAMLPSISPSGSAVLCTPSTLSLTGSPAGTWSSSVTAVGTVSTSGVVTGITNGTTNITYTASGCTSFINVTVGTTPTVTGTPAICFPGTTTLTGSPAGGTWTSSATGVATVSGGVVTGVAVGTTIINYNTGTCSVNTPVDVNSPTAVTPTTQPTGIAFSGATPTGATINFTPNGSTGYLVVACTTNTLSAAPATYTTYATGSSFGGGIVVQGSASGSAPAYTTSLLNSNTFYYVFVFAFNNNCTGPQYNVVAPLTGSFNTCVGPTSVPAIGTVGVNSINLSWTASPAGGAYIDPINYTVYAFSDAACTTPVPGYPVAAGIGTTYTATGLATGTQYYFRVSPADACAILSPIATGMTSCATAGTIPYLQTFEVNTTLGDRSPNCMTSNVQNCVFSGVQTSVTYIGTINTNHTAGGSKFYNFFRGGACSAGWANQWLLLPPLAMSAGTTYTLSFWYKTDGFTWSSVQAQYSTSSTVPAVSSTSMGGTPGTIGSGLSGITTTGYTQYIQTFTVPSTGTYYVGIDAQSGGSASLLAIDDIEICAVPTVTATHASAPYCAPATVTLSSSGTSGAITYDWTGPSGFTSTVTTPLSFTGLGAGTYTYTLSAVNDPISAGFGGYCTASVTTTFTVNNPPSAISGTASICSGQTTTLTNTTSGGSWSSSAPAVGTISSTGVVTGISGGTTTITYNIGGCFATLVVTVIPMPAAITGILIACYGSTTTLLNSVSGGTWSSSNGNATVATPSSGVITGSNLGTSIITYSTGGSCYVTAVVTVNPMPAPITGSFGICVGTTTTLSSTTPGGIWTSSSPGTASVGPVTGVVTGVSLGTANISYRVAGCSVIQVVTVVAAPATIVGPTSVCLYYPTITLTNISSGGTWSSSNANASVVATTGVVTGNIPGTSTITYALSAGCQATMVVTVLPAPASITGTPTVCAGGGTTTLSHSVTGGTWISGTTSVATVGFGTGLVTGVTGGTSIITYTLPTGCVAILTVTVNNNPAPITGLLNICMGATSALSSATPGVTWSSSTPSVATIGSLTGIATGISAGTATIVCTNSGGCQTTAIITVNAVPAPVTGTYTVCVGTSTALSCTTPAVVWSSSNLAVCSVSGAGLVTGLSTGTSTIAVTNAAGCQNSVTVTVNPSPAAITGTPVLCVGFTTTLACATPGGVWSSSNLAVASILSPGLIGGVSAGTAIISYTVGGCSSTIVATVNALPGSVTGPLNVCVLTTTTLSATPAGGSWSSGSGNASVDAVTGVVTGVSAGTASITYSVGSGCITTATVTVNTIPTPISGTLNICAGVTTTLSSSPSGGTWVSSDVAVGTIGVGTGIATGIAPGGTATISYTLSSGCRNTAVLTVNPIPAAITGATNVCVGATTTLNCTTAGGTWSSSNGNASINPLTGVVTGVLSGTSTISYILPSGCYRTIVVLINALPSAISGSLQVCEGATSTLTGTPAGGTWISSTPAAGTIGIGSGTLGGLAFGTTTITYTVPSGCYLTAIATINPLPGAITGTLTTCIGQTTTLAGTPAGGTWVSSTPASGTINATGTVGGVAAGTTTISYTLPTTCRRTAIVTVFALPGVITGAANVCEGLTTTLNCAPTGGTWTTSAPGIATVGVTTGVVSGISSVPPGTATITYTVGTGCTRTTTVTVNPLPGPITSGLTTCVGQSTTLTGSPTGGTWSSSTASVATVVSGTGVVSGISGTLTSTITYTLPTTCINTAIVTVYALPSNITGSLQVCLGQTTPLTTASPGGTWSSSTPVNASVNPSTGLVTGNSLGTATITYTLGTGCIKTAIVTVNALPAAIAGSLQVCQGMSTTLTNATPGGTWSSSTPAIATITSGGVVNGITPGTTTISYTSGVGCNSLVVVTVNNLPGSIVGPGVVCANSTITLGCSPSGGTWSTGSANASVNIFSGVVTGISAGTAAISYTIGTGCVRTTNVTVNALPNAITGNAGICIGASSLLATTSTGGVWSSTVPAVATVDATGLVTSVSVGTTIISYALTTTGCASTVVVTVNPLPAPITGSAGFCNLSTTLYSDASPGGTWTSANPLILSIDPLTGMATGNLVDTTDIIYTLPTTCSTTKRVFLILAPYPITGPVDVCLGQCVPLSNAISGGGWSSSNPANAPITSAGVVCGIALGTTNITYVLSTGCFTAHPMTVNPVPGGIAGSLQVCEGLTSMLFNPTPGGFWYSGDTAVATVDPATGVVTGVSGGTADITYRLGTGCNSIVVMTVNPLPSAITGSAQVCEGLSTTLASTTPGGTWSSANPSVAFIDPATGIMTGISATTTGTGGIGQTTITYVLPTGCLRSLQVTVNPLPSPITGVHNICVGENTLLSNITTGGGWISSNPAVGTIDGVSGVFTGITPGCVTISYVLPTGCIATWALCVNANPVPITGSLSVCAGFSTNLSSGPSGGFWSQDPASLTYGTIHTITGVVSGVLAGVIPVTYTLGSGCRTVEAVTVITLPALITGTANVCVGGQTTLSNPASGGTWSSSHTTIGTVDAVTGVVTGISAGTTVITYQVGTGCFNVLTVTVNPLPAAITGPLQVCEGSTILLASTSSGGNWISDATPVATVDYMSGLVSGITAGTANITYTLGTGCLQSVQVSVNTTPGPISGNPHVCIGASNTFTNAMPGGTWVSSNPTIATIGPTTGIVTSVSLGVITISYVLPVTGCMATKVVTVHPLPVAYAVTGGGNYCSGTGGVHIGLSNSQPGVSYVLYNGASAVGYLSGTGFPIDFGLMTASGTYTVAATNVTSGCMKNMTGSATVVVIPLIAPSVTIATTPTGSVCPGQTMILTAMPVNGGTGPTYLWKVNGVSVTTASSYSFVPADGDIATVTMTSNANCLSTTTANAVRTITVLPSALPIAGVITSPDDSVCQYNPVTFTAAPVYGGSAPSYTWNINGAFAGTGPTYTYIPDDGDMITLDMVSNYQCRTATNVTSGVVTMSVDELLIPHVSVWPDPGFGIEAGHPVTLHTTVTDAGPNPKYQWKLNGYAIPGATLDIYTAIFNDYDSISCVVTSSGVCGNIGTHDWVFITVYPESVPPVATSAIDIRLLPNPNKGTFNLKGTLGNMVDQDVNVDITDMLGQVVYRGTLRTSKGNIDTQLTMRNSLANGMYILTLRTETLQKAFHFVMEQ